MTPLLLTGGVLLLGLSIAQVLSTIQVYVSNLDYYTFLAAVHEAGYLAVPNPYVFSTLRGFGPAFRGGLFFTCTSGACLTLISFGLAWAWIRLFSRNKIVLFLYSALLPLCLLAANRRGFSPLITGYLLAIPIPVFLFTAKRLPEQSTGQRHPNVFSSVILFLMISLFLILWQPSRMGTDAFLDIRDSLLLSNPMGRQVNAFYYENSLYATHVFKPLGRRLLKACRLEGVSDPSLRRRLTRTLLSRDYLPLGKGVRPDLRIALSDQGLSFYRHNRLLLTSSVNDFLRNPSDTFTRVEAGADPHGFFRRFTLVSILLVGALFLYGCAYGPWYGLSGLFLPSIPRSIKAGVLGPVTLLCLWFAFSGFSVQDPSDPKQLAGMMTSEHLHTRIAALKYILRNRIDIASLPSYRSMLKSRHIAERYWLAKALGVSRTPETRQSLHELLEDPHFNVVCMAMDSLGRRGNRADINPILGKINTSHNGYVQWYAYRAVRRLGWRQKEPHELSVRPVDVFIARKHRLFVGLVNRNRILKDTRPQRFDLFGIVRVEQRLELGDLGRHGSSKVRLFGRILGEVVQPHLVRSVRNAHLPAL